MFDNAIGYSSTMSMSSPFVVGPPVESDQDLFGFHAQRNRLREHLEGGQSVQILGGQRMGKTSLLKWVERHAPGWQKRPVVWINAQGLAGQSPAALVLAVADELDRRDEAEQALKRAGGGSSAAARVLKELLPLVLLVDEASCLAQQHDFDVGFLGALRAFCQDFRLIWVSTSYQDIRKLFSDTGLASRFLNDARFVWVGQLEDGDARKLVSKLNDKDLAETAMREAGGFAYALQWLGDSLWRDPSDPEASCDALADGMQVVFDDWWRRLDTKEQGLLKRCVSGLPRSELVDRQHRRSAQRLKRQGLLTEDAERFVLLGAVWREFVKAG